MLSHILKNSHLRLGGDFKGCWQLQYYCINSLDMQLYGSGL